MSLSFVLSLSTNQRTTITSGSQGSDGVHHPLAHLLPGLLVTSGVADKYIIYALSYQLFCLDLWMAAKETSEHAEWFQVSGAVKSSSVQLCELDAPKDTQTT